MAHRMHRAKGPLAVWLTVLCLFLGGCGPSSRTITAIGWAWPLPPPSLRTPEFARQAREAAELARLRAVLPWAGDEAQGRGGAAPLDSSIEDPVTADLLARVQAREAARRHLAERIAALPAPLMQTAGAGPTPRLGDPGVLSPDHAARLSHWIATAPIVSEQRSPTDGRREATAGLSLRPVARLVLGEPLDGTEPGAAPLTGTVPPIATPPSAPPTTAVSASARRRSALPPLRPEDYSEQATRLAGDSDSVAITEAFAAEARLEAQRRALRLARAWLAEDILDRRIDERIRVRDFAAATPANAEWVRRTLEQRPARAVVWDSLGRCRVVVDLDWDVFHAALRAQTTPGAARNPFPINEFP